MHSFSLFPIKPLLNPLNARYRYLASQSQWISFILLAKVFIMPLGCIFRIHFVVLLCSLYFETLELFKYLKIRNAHSIFLYDLSGLLLSRTILSTSKKQVIRKLISKKHFSLILQYFLMHRM